VVVLAMQPDATGFAGRGLQAAYDGQVTMDSCAFVGNVESAMVVGSAGVDVTITNSILRSSGQGVRTMFGYGLVAIAGSVSLDSSFVRDNVGVGLAIDGSSVGIANVVVADNQVGIYVTGGTLEEEPTQPSSLGATQVVVSQSQFVGNVTRVSSMMLPLATVAVAVPAQP
jgi:hypothetical protein